MILRKTYGLPEEILEIISRVREERNIKSDTEALIHIITEYKNQRELASIIADEIEERNSGWME